MVVNAFRSWYWATGALLYKVWFPAAMAVEKLPNEACADHPLLEAFHPDLLPSVIPLPYEATTPHSQLIPFQIEGHLVSSTC
jgi:hypothetical protein